MTTYPPSPDKTETKNQGNEGKAYLYLVVVIADKHKYILITKYKYQPMQLILDELLAKQNYWATSVDLHGKAMLLRLHI